MKLANWVGTAAAVLVAVAALAGPAPAQADDARCSKMEVSISSSLSSGDVARFEAEFRGALDKVCDWWGKTYSGKISIEVLEPRGPSMALVPAWRGNRGHMTFRAGAIARNITATVHELVHLFAPNANRFLAEGLAVYGQALLADTAAYPTFGADLHVAARRLADASLPYLDGFATPQRMTTEQYVVAGSFVRYLIETHGMAKFRALYAMTPLVPRQRDAGRAARWREVYGADIEELGAAWSARVSR